MVAAGVEEGVFLEGVRREEMGRMNEGERRTHSSDLYRLLFYNCVLLMPSSFNFLSFFFLLPPSPERGIY